MDIHCPLSQPRQLNFVVVYRHVDDIDLFPGGVSEASVAGGVVGPTFACILGNQFQHIRKGDRYWYENDNDVGLTLGMYGGLTVYPGDLYCPYRAIMKYV